jgi:hypothetical protein
MSYQLKVIKDYPIGFWPLDESSGTTAADISGCGNNGTYTGGLSTGLIPLVSGGLNGSLINNTKYITLPVTKDYYGSTADGGFADENSSDNDFSLEVWIYPKFTTSSLTPIFADSSEDVGIYYEKGNIVFKLEGERIDYTLPIVSSSIHIVAVYSKSSMSLYVNGKFGSSKALDNFKFTSPSITLKVGPTTSASDSFIVDAPAVYRYGLDLNLAAEHYSISSGVSPLQVAYPENGTLFDIYDDGVSRQYAFMYPANRPWEYFLTEDLIYNGEEQYIEIKKTATAASKSVVITDAIAIPSGFNLDSSKIEWNGDNGVSVRASTDGTTWQPCINGRSIPQFKLDDSSFSTERTLYLEITLASSDASKYLPRLYSLILCFYNDQILYSQTNGDYLNTLDGLSGATIKEITTGRISHPILSRHKNNGLRTGSASGFKVNTSESIRTVEFFLTLSDLTANCILFSSADGTYVASKFAWGNTGTIDKTNISSIHVNGIDKTSATNISTVFTADELYHIVIVTSGPITGPIRFNYLSSGGPSSLYQYLSYYPEAFTSQNAVDHYNMHIGRTSSVADDSSVALTENAVNFYNNDWIVIQNR